MYYKEAYTHASEIDLTIKRYNRIEVKQNSTHSYVERLPMYNYYEWLL